MQFELKTVQDPELGELTALSERPDGGFIASCERMIYGTEALLSRPINFGHSHIAHFQVDRSPELSNEYFEPLLSIGDSLSTYPLKENETPLTRIMDIQAGYVGYMRVATKTGINNDNLELALDGFFILDTEHGTTRRLDYGDFLLRLTESGHPVVYSKDGEFTLTWNEQLGKWDRHECIVDNKVCQLKAGDLFGHHIFIPPTGEELDEFGVRKHFLRFCNEESIRLDELIDAPGVHGSLAFGISHESRCGESCLNAMYWLNGSKGSLVYDHYRSGEHVGAPRSATSVWGIDRLRYTIIGDVMSIKRNGPRALQIGNAGGAVLWDTTSEKLMNGDPIKGIDLSEVVPEDVVLAAKQIVPGAILVETGRNCSALLTYE